MYLDVFGIDISSLEQLLFSLLFPKLDSLLFPAPSHLVAVQSGILVPGFVQVPGALGP